MSENPLGKKLLPRSDDECKYNAKLAYIVSPTGKQTVIKRLCCERNVITDGSYDRDPEKRPEKEPIRGDPEDLKTMSAADLQKLQRLEELLDKRPPEITRSAAGDDLERSARRAKAAIFDYMLAEWEFALFITLTLDPEKADRYDAKQAAKIMCTWANNRVQRQGLKYLIVPEYHKDGAIHFHGVINDVLEKVDSGTVLRPEGGRPVKRDTVRRAGGDPGTCKTVYNLPGWGYGFSTAIELDGDREAVAGYICKYVTKELAYADGDREKIGGRFYYHSQNIRRPQEIVYQDDFETFEGREFETPGGRWKINREKTEICKTEKLQRSAAGPFGREYTESDKEG